MKFGIMGAMAEEISLLCQHIKDARSETHGMRTYISGELYGKAATIVFSRWGKVAASSTATLLVEKYDVDFLVFSGVAGAIDSTLNIGDVVIADTLVQHDMDASALPGIEKFEIPLLGVSRFLPKPHHVRSAVQAAETYITQDLCTDVSADVREAFGITVPRVVTGTVASGDQFIAHEIHLQALREKLPGLKCVEMEGAAVAQVAYEHDIPYVVMRTISDKADHSAVVDFPRFIRKIASHFTCGCVRRLFEIIRD